jgi:probable addiction module antidote protein
MKRKFRTHDEYLIETLKDPNEAALFLNAALEENDQDLLMVAIGQVARSQGLTKLAKRTNVSRMGLYKMLARHKNPGLKTFLSILEASGITIQFKPRALAA